MHKIFFYGCGWNISNYSCMYGKNLKNLWNSKNKSILQEGAILFDYGKTLTPHQFCIDFRANKQTKNYDLKLGVCVDSDDEPENHVRLIIPIGMIN